MVIVEFLKRLILDQLDFLMAKIDIFETKKEELEIVFDVEENLLLRHSISSSFSLFS